MNINQLLVNSLLGQLRNKNPEGYNQVIQLMNSGKSPSQALNELLASGQFSQEQLNQVMNQQNNPRKF